MRLSAAIAQDIRFQYRHGFYYVYAILTVLYIVVLQLLPDQLLQPTLTLILFSDVCTLGFFFIGAIVLLERSQNITESLFVTPFLLHEYLLAKLVSFLVLSTVSALIIIVGSGSQKADFLWFIYGLIMSSILFTLFGLLFAGNR
ncbi:ABC transporter permease [bacterium]|nr:ABC transporter permease [bacterium]